MLICGAFFSMMPGTSGSCNVAAVICLLLKWWIARVPKWGGLLRNAVLSQIGMAEPMALTTTFCSQLDFTAVS